MNEENKYCGECEEILEEGDNFKEFICQHCENEEPIDLDYINKEQGIAEQRLESWKDERGRS